MKMVYGVENWKSLVVNCLGGTKKFYTLEDKPDPRQGVVILIHREKCPRSS